MRLNNENITSIKETLSGTPRLNSSSLKKSYAKAVKGSNSNNNGQETPKSTKSSRTPRTSKPVVSGTSGNVIGKLLSPNQRNVRRGDMSKLEKAVWISRLHRETTVEEMTSYNKDKIGIVSTDHYQVRKLVKKDCDLSEYSFVSFRLTCATNIFETLLDAQNRPHYCQIREFDMKRKISTGVRLDQQSSATPEQRTTISDESKNEGAPTNVTMEVETSR